jgi:hypothetical protein
MIAVIEREDGTAMVQIALPDGTLLKRRADMVTAIKVLDLLDQSTRNKVARERVIDEVDEGSTRSSPVSTSDVSETYKIPSRGEILKYIRSKQDYSHSVEDIIGELVGQEILSLQTTETERLKNAIRSKTARIRNGIEKQESGHWAEDRAGPYKIFKFIKSNGLSKYEERELQE